MRSHSPMTFIIFKKSFGLFFFQMTTLLPCNTGLDEVETRMFDCYFISIVCREHGKTANSGILQG